MQTLGHSSGREIDASIKSRRTGTTMGDIVETLKKMWWTYCETQVF